MWCLQCYTNRGKHQKGDGFLCKQQIQHPSLVKAARFRIWNGSLSQALCYQRQINHISIFTATQICILGSRGHFLLPQAASECCSYLNKFMTSLHGLLLFQQKGKLLPVRRVKPWASCAMSISLRLWKTSITGHPEQVGLTLMLGLCSARGQIN